MTFENWYYIGISAFGLNVLFSFNLFLVLQGTQVVSAGKRRLVDTHWNRGMSYLRLGWNWIRLALTRQWSIQIYPFLSSLPDPEPAFASKVQREKEFKRQFTVLKRIPAS